MNLQAPLVPAEVDLRDFQYMELDVQLLRDSKFSAEVDAEAFRAGVLLWCASWHQVPAGSLPDNDIELSNLAGFGRVVKEWRKVRAEALSLFVACSDGRLYHPVIADKAVAAWESRLRHHHAKLLERMRKDNKKRTDEKLEPLPYPTFDDWNSDRLSAGIPADAQKTSAGIPAENALRGNGTERERNGEGTEIREKRVGAAPDDPPSHSAADASATRGTRLAADWNLPKPWGEWAIAEFSTWTEAVVRTEAAKFADFWRAKTGKDATKLDWLMTWRNWCRNARGPQARAGPADLAAKNAAAKRLVFPDSNAHTFDA